MKYKAEFRINGTDTYLILDVAHYDGPKEEAENDLQFWGTGRNLALVGLEEVSDEN